MTGSVEYLSQSGRPSLGFTSCNRHISQLAAIINSATLHLVSKIESDPLCSRKGRESSRATKLCHFATSRETKRDCVDRASSAGMSHPCDKPRYTFRRVHRCYA
jgi:hypothetical protein